MNSLCVCNGLLDFSIASTNCIIMSVKLVFILFFYNTVLKFLLHYVFHSSPKNLFFNCWSALVVNSYIGGFYGCKLHPVLVYILVPRQSFNTFFLSFILSFRFFFPIFFSYVVVNSPLLHESYQLRRVVVKKSAAQPPCLLAAPVLFSLEIWTWNHSTMGRKLFCWATWGPHNMAMCLHK